MAEDTESGRWLHAVLRMGLSAAAHPVEYVKVLIQIGYEPFPPRPTKTFFGKPALALPGVVEYMGFIKKRDGLTGLYSGVVPRLCGSFVSGYVFSKAVEKIEVDETGEAEASCTEEKIVEFLQVTSRDMAARCLAITASQPFQVITVRMIAQFVGRESEYSGVISSVKSIFVNDGISGFFSGLVPRLMSEILSLWIASSLTFVINTYLVEDAEFKNYTSAAMTFIASALTYPFTLISNIMAVNNSGLAAGAPPFMPSYSSWKQCWSHLSEQNQLKRGSSLLWRYYTGPPFVFRDGKVTSSTDFNALVKRPPGYSPSYSNTHLGQGDRAYSKAAPSLMGNVNFLHFHGR